MRTILLILYLVLSASIVEAATQFRVEPVNATVAFSIKKWGVIEEEGAFRDFDGTILFDGKDPSKSRVDFEVQARSIDTKNGNRDSTLRSEDFFHVSKYPTLSFRSTRVAPRGDGVADVTGDLTIRGVTRRITVPVRLIGISLQPRVGEIAAFETSFTIDRRTFGVNGGGWTAAAPGVLGNTVTIRIAAGAIAK